MHVNEARPGYVLLMLYALSVIMGAVASPCADLIQDVLFDLAMVINVSIKQRFDATV